MSNGMIVDQILQIRNLPISLVFILELTIVGLWQWHQIKSEAKDAYHLPLTSLILGFLIGLYINFDHVHILFVLAMIGYILLPAVSIRHITGNSKRKMHPIEALNIHGED